MTEQQLREKLQFAYGNMPDATRAAFEHSLTHHRAPETHRNIGLSRDDAHRHHRCADGANADGGWRGGGAVLSVTDVHPQRTARKGSIRRIISR